MRQPLVDIGPVRAEKPRQHDIGVVDLDVDHADTDVVPLADVAEGASVRVLRFENEAEDLLHYLKDTGLTPGLEGVLARAGDDEVVVEAGEVKHAVTRSVAETVSVVADPSPPQRTALPDQLVLGRERYGR